MRQMPLFDEWGLRPAGLEGAREYPILVVPLLVAPVACAPQRRMQGRMMSLEAMSVFPQRGWADAA